MMTDRGSEDKGVPAEIREKIQWAIRTDNTAIAAVRGIITGILLAALLGGLLFAYTGVWPPLTAVTSSSMEPNIDEGDLVLLTATNGEDAEHGASLTTHQPPNGESHSAFNKPGDVIVFDNGGDGETIIHRAHLHVEKGENWYDRANPEYVGQADGCAELRNCPAPHDGYITKGDNNPSYDQAVAGPVNEPVKDEWVNAKATNRVPHLGYARIWFGGFVAVAVILLAIDALRNRS